MRYLLAAAALALAAPVAAQEEMAEPATAAAPSAADTEAIHNALRGLRDRLVTAVNERDEAALLAAMEDDILFTAMNNEVVRGKDEASAYYERMLVGSQRIVEDMSLSAEADDLSILLADGEVAVAAGDSVAHFDMMAGQSFEVPLRWTATLNNTDGEWKVQSIHFSSNIFDNPIMGGVQSFAYWIAGGLGLLGLLIGFLLGRRRRKT